MRLSEPTDIPEPYRDTCIDFLRMYWNRATWIMGDRWGFHNLPLQTEDDLLHAMIAEDLAIIAKAANGDTEHNDWNVGIVAETIEGICEDLHPFNYATPTDFWESSIGQMMARANLWLQGDELITIAEAARIRGVTPQAISAGRLTGYIDPSAPQCQVRRLVSRAEVENS
jgi:hypothetical protein